MVRHPRSSLLCSALRVVSGSVVVSGSGWFGWQNDDDEDHDNKDAMAWQSSPENVLAVNKVNVLLPPVRTVPRREGIFVESGFEIGDKVKTDWRAIIVIQMCCGFTALLLPGKSHLDQVELTILDAD